jgi:signal transduction histidine kinase
VRRHVDRLAAPGDPLLDLLLETSPSGMLVLDGQGRIRRGNAIASRLLGPRVALDQKLLDHLAVEARAQAAAALRLAMTSQAASRFVARLVGTPEERHVSANAVPIPETAGPPAGCLLYLTDITRGRALEAELLQGQKLQAVGQLAGGIAHDFNNLLTTIITASDLILQRETLDEETRADAAHVHASAARGSALVKQLLGFSRQQAATPQALAVNVAIVSLADMLRRLLGSRLRLDLELAPADALVQVDPTQLDQVLVNLALNARAAMADRGVLTVRTVCLGLAGPTQVGPQTIPPGRYARIDVEDTGTGIPAAHLRSVLHHPAGPGRHRPGAVDGAGDHSRQQRLPDGAEPARPRRLLQHFSADPGDAGGTGGGGAGCGGDRGGAGRPRSHAAGGADRAARRHAGRAGRAGRGRAGGGRGSGVDHPAGR